MVLSPARRRPVQKHFHEGFRHRSIQRLIRLQHMQQNVQMHQPSKSHRKSPGVKSPRQLAVFLAAPDQIFQKQIALEPLLEALGFSRNLSGCSHRTRKSKAHQFPVRRGELEHCYCDFSQLAGEGGGASNSLAHQTQPFFSRPIHERPIKARLAAEIIVQHWPRNPCRGDDVTHRGSGITLSCEPFQGRLQDVLARVSLTVHKNLPNGRSRLTPCQAIFFVPGIWHWAIPFALDRRSVLIAAPQQIALTSLFQKCMCICILCSISFESVRHGEPVRNASPWNEAVAEPRQGSSRRLPVLRGNGIDGFLSALHATEHLKPRS